MNNLQTLYSQHLQQLIEANHKIMIVIESGEENFYLVKTFEPPVESSNAPINYMKIFGVCINEFLKTKCISEQTLQTLKLFEMWLEKKNDYTYQFSTKQEWKLIKLGK